MVLHCSIRGPREGRLYYNRGAKGHVPLTRKQSLSTCLMCPGVPGSWEIQVQGWSRKVGPVMEKTPHRASLRLFFSTGHMHLFLTAAFRAKCRIQLLPWEQPCLCHDPGGCGSRQGPWVPSIFPPWIYGHREPVWMGFVFRNLKRLVMPFQTHDAT